MAVQNPPGEFPVLSFIASIHKIAAILVLLIGAYTILNMPSNDLWAVDIVLWAFTIFVPIVLWAWAEVISLGIGVHYHTGAQLELLETMLVEMKEQLEQKSAPKESAAHINQNVVHISPRVRSLIKAAKQGQEMEVEKLVSSGVGVNNKDEHGYTAIMHAAAAKKAGCVRLLLTLGADPSIKLPNGRTALDLARMMNADEVVDVLTATTPI